MMLTLTDDFRLSACRLPPLETEEDVIANHDAIYRHNRHFLEVRDFRVALPAQRLLVKKKVNEPTEEGQDIRRRRDGRTPDYLHEGRIALSIQADHLDGLLRREYLERALTLAYLHDLGEDFKIMPDNMGKYLVKEIGKPLPPTPDIQNILINMERLTFDRKYTAAEMGKVVGLSRLHEDDVSPEFLNDIFLDVLKGQSLTVGDRLPPLQIMELPPKAPKTGEAQTAPAPRCWVVSRHIKDGILDWNLYIQTVAEDPIAIYVKMKDRCDGLGTRIGPKFVLEDYSGYLNKSFQTFSIDNLGKRMAERYPEMAKAFDATDKMLGALHRIGRTYISVHPDRNLPGSKGYNIETLQPMDLDPYFPGATLGYRLMPKATNPLQIILTRLLHDGGLDEKADIFHAKIMDAIHRAEKRNGVKPDFALDQFELHF